MKKTAVLYLIPIGGRFVRNRNIWIEMEWKVVGRDDITNTSTNGNACNSMYISGPEWNRYKRAYGRWLRDIVGCRHLFIIWWNRYRVSGEIADSGLWCGDMMGGLQLKHQCRYYPLLGCRGVSTVGISPGRWRAGIIWICLAKDSWEWNHSDRRPRYLGEKYMPRLH